MDVSLVIALSIVLQLIAAVIALRLMRITGVPVAWLLLSGAILLMAVRRSVSLARYLSGDPAHQPDMLAELLALAISLLMVVGIAGIAKLFSSIRENQEALKSSEARYRELAGELEQRVDERTSELTSVNRELEDTVSSLLNSEECLEEAQRIGRIGSWELDHSTNRFKWSDQIYKIFEIDPAGYEASYEAFLGSIHPEDREQVREAFSESLSKRVPYDIVHRLLMKDGRAKFVHERGETVFDEHRNPVRTLGTVQDITDLKEAEDELARASSEWNHAMDFFEDAIYLVGLDDKVVRANRAFYALTGLKPQQTIGHNIVSIMHPHGEASPCPVCQARITRRDARITMEADHPENPVKRPIEVMVKIIRNDRGDPTSVLMGIHDLTRQREIQDELRQHRDNLEQLVADRTRESLLRAQIIDQIHDSVVSTDLDGVVTSWNRGAERLFGYSAAEALGKHISFVYPEEEHSYLLEQVIAPLKEKGEHETEVRMRRKNGNDFFAHLALSMLRGKDGVAEGMIGYSMDITDRKAAESELRRRRDALAATNRELEAFSYSVSHDLRAPLRAIDGFSQLLIEDYNDRLDEVGKDYLERVRNGAQRMAELIDDLLELSRVGRHELIKQNVDLSRLAEGVVRKLREIDPDRAVEVDVTPGLVVSGDRRLLAIVLDNLLGNAWKYTGTVDGARIEFGQFSQRNECVFYVRDNGVGFDMAYADKLFGPFQRLHGKEFEGTGIGLASVQRIVQRHGGRVWAEGKEKAGATFYFALPC